MTRAAARSVLAAGRRVATARRGQSTVEYVLLIAVLVIGLLVAAYALLPGFSDGVDGLGDDVTALFGAGTENGSGDMR